MDKREGLLQLLHYAAIIAAGISTALGGVVLIGWLRCFKNHQALNVWQ